LKRLPDVEVLFEFNDVRKRPTCNGYRPDHLIREDYLTCGQHCYYGEELVQPGEQTFGTITFLAPEHYPESLWIGKRISFQEGAKIVGYATIERIFNPILINPLKTNISVGKAKFLWFLEFPHEWLEFELYPDEVWKLQQIDFEKDREEKGWMALPEKYGLGSEHYRYAAFRWWLSQNVTSFVFEKLKRAVEKDPDEMVKWAMIQDLEEWEK